MRSLRALVILTVIASPAIASGRNAETERLRDAEAVIKAAVTAPDQGIPKELLGRAECIGVFPEVKKAAFVVGGEFGRGVFTCRQKDGTMGSPAYFTIGGGSLGWQIGGEETDLVLLVMNEDGMHHLLADRFALGAEATAAAGPVGRTTQASTDAMMQAQILSWSRSRGLFVGASLKGTVIKPDAKASLGFYGRTVSPREILVEHSVQVPKAAQSFVTTATTCSRRS